MTGGALGFPLDRIPLAGLSGNVPGTHELVLGPSGVRDRDPLEHGAPTIGRPQAIRSLSKTGAKAFSFFDDFYNVVHMLPPALSFGAVATDTSQPAAIWNAHLDDVTLTAIAAAGASDVTLGGAAAPVTLRSLQTIPYTVTALGAGAPSFAAAFTFTFDDDEVLTLTATGTRAKLWGYRPNWRDSYTVDYTYSTEILTSRSGKEQRRALRSSPRKAIEFTATLSDAQLRSFVRDMASWQARPFIMAEIPRQARAVLEMTGNAATMTVDAVPAWLVAGALVMLSSGDQQDVRTVDSLDGADVTFTSSGALPWPAGTMINPAITGRVAASLSAQDQTNATSEIAVHFDAQPGSEADAPPDAPETFNGRELATFTPNWGAAVQTTFTHDVETIDYGGNSIATFLPILFSKRVRQAVFVGQDYASAVAIENFFRRMKGQRGEFYMSTGACDLVIKGTSALGTNGIRVDGTATADAYAGDTVYKAVSVFLMDGTRLNNVVQGIDIVDDDAGHDSIVRCEDTWSADLSPANVRMISWLPAWRLASDELAVEWLTDSVAQISLSVMTIEDLLAD